MIFISSGVAGMIFIFHEVAGLIIAVIARINRVAAESGKRAKRLNSGAANPIYQPCVWTS